MAVLQVGTVKAPFDGAGLAEEGGGVEEIVFGPITLIALS